MPDLSGLQSFGERMRAVRQGGRMQDVAAVFRLAYEGETEQALAKLATLPAEDQARVRAAAKLLAGPDWSAEFFRNGAE